MEERSRLAQMLLAPPAAAPVPRRNYLVDLAGMPRPGQASVGMPSASHPTRELDTVDPLARLLLAGGSGRTVDETRRVYDQAGQVTNFAGGIRAFHGSPHRFDRFDMGRAGTTTDPGELGRALYFTTDGATAMNPPFSGPGTKWPNRYEVDLNIQKPLDVPFPRWGADKGQLVRDALGLPRSASAADVTAEATRRGYDSVRLDYSPVNYNSQEIAVFDENAINILRRYGLFGLAAGAGGAAATGQAQAAPQQ